MTAKEFLHARGIVTGLSSQELIEQAMEEFAQQPTESREKRYVQMQSLDDAKCGMIVRNKGSFETYQIYSNNGTNATAIKVIDITNPSEWEVYK